MSTVWNYIKHIDENFNALKMIAVSQSYHRGSALLVSFAGDVYGIGENRHGCLGQHIDKTRVPVKVLELSSFSGVSVCAMYGDALAYTREGKLYVWGENVEGNTCTKPVLLKNLPNIVDAMCIAGHYLALTDQGKVYQWRGNQTSLPEFQSLNTKPTAVEFNETIVAIASGPHHSLAVTRYGDVYSFGFDSSIRLLMAYDFGNVLCDGSFSPVTKLTIPRETIAKVACGDTHSLSLTHSGKIYTWGYNSWGLGDDGCNVESGTPLQVGEDLGSFKDIATNGSWTNAAVTESGAVYMWGMDGKTSKVAKPLLTKCTEIQQVFSKIHNSTCTWTYKDSYCLTADNSAFFIMEIPSTFNKEDFSDLTLFVGEKPIYVHKYVLQLRSEFFFRTWLQERWTNKNTRKIELKCYDYEVYLSYLWYLYSREIKTTSEHILDLWELAVGYGEEKLELGLETLIAKNVTTKTLLYNSRTTRQSLSDMENSISLEEKINNVKADYEMQCQTLKNEYINTLEKLKNECKVSQEKDEAQLTRLTTLLESEVLTTEQRDNKLELKMAKLEEDFSKLEKNYAELEIENSELRKLKNILEEDNLKLGKQISKLKSDQANVEMINTKIDGLYAILQQTLRISADNCENPEKPYSEVAEMQKEGKGAVGNSEAINLEETVAGKRTHEKPETGQIEIKGTNMKTQTCQSEVKGDHKVECDHLETEEISRKLKRSYKKHEEDYTELQTLCTKLEES